jgi:hypothetical protein
MAANSLCQLGRGSDEVAAFFFHTLGIKVPLVSYNRYSRPTLSTAANVPLLGCADVVPRS